MIMQVEVVNLEEYHAIGYGQEDECKAFELHCERLPAMPRTALKVSYRKRAVRGTVTCIPCRSFKCKERQEIEPRSQTVVDVNPTGCRKVQRTCVPLSCPRGCATVRHYALLCGMIVVSGVKRLLLCCNDYTLSALTEYLPHYYHTHQREQ